MLPFRYLSETIPWCREHVSVHAPKECLRTPALRPSNLSIAANEAGNFDYTWGTLDEKRNTVVELAERRAAMPRTDNAYLAPLRIDLAGGRLLLVVPEESDWCGLSEYETGGFIDVLDLPAWDTWVCFMHEITTPDEEQVRETQEVYRRAFYNQANQQDFSVWQPPAMVEYILCWIPPEFVAMVEEGIKVNPVECFFWAGDYKRRHYNTPLLRQFEAAGLLG